MGARPTQIEDLRELFRDSRIWLGIGLVLATELADEPVRLLSERTQRPGVDRFRGELQRYLRRLGRPAEAFPGCPEEFAAGLRGDWRAAADAWALHDALQQADGDIAAALRKWEPSQLALSAALAERVVAMGERAQFTNTWIPGDPELRFGLYGPGR